MVQQNVERLQKLVNGFHLAVLPILVAITSSLLEVDRGHQSTVVEPISLGLDVDGFLESLDGLVVIFVDTVEIGQSDQTLSDSIHDLIHIYIALTVLYPSPLLFVKSPSHLEVHYDDFFVVSFLLISSFHHFLLLLGPFRLIVHNLRLIVKWLFSLLIRKLRLFAFVKLLGDVFNEVFFGLMDIVGQSSLVEDLQVVFYFLEDEVAVLEVELGHTVGVLTELVLGFEHESVEIFVDLVAGGLLDHSQMCFQVIYLLLSCHSNLNYEKTRIISLPVL